MDTKEAIKYVNGFRIVYPGNRGCNEERKENIDKVISLLQELEKYKAMWEELKKESDEDVFKACFDNSVYYSRRFKSVITYIEQKYFPQSVKKTITIEIEGEDGKLDWSINALKKYINNMIMDGMKVNIKEED